MVHSQGYRWGGKTDAPASFAPNGYAWGVTLKEDSGGEGGGGWMIEKEEDVVCRMQALQVSLGKVREKGGGGIGCGSARELPGNMWFEVILSNGESPRFAHPV